MRRTTLLLPRSTARGSYPSAWTIGPRQRCCARRAFSFRRDDSEPQGGTSTPAPAVDSALASRSRFYFEAGYALFAKRPSRPFPPPFSSPPSTSFSDPLSTHNRSKDKRQYYDGELIRGITNGDDAVLVSENLIAANDGVGAWAAKPRGHAALWSRLILHFWALEAERDAYGSAPGCEPDPRGYLQRAYEATKAATSSPNEWLGTTTACGALMASSAEEPARPVLYVTQLGDSAVLVIRPREAVGSEVVYRTEEQWHWFDCPRQLGTNSPDTPDGEAVVDRIEIEEGDVVLAMSDGVVDNLWEHEVVANVKTSLDKAGMAGRKTKQDMADGMQFVAAELVKAARVIAQDPFAESPFMERAVEEGLAMEGGKPDDISVVAAICKKRP